MNSILRYSLLLCCIAGVAGLLLGVTNALTAPVIEEQAMQAADQDRYALFPEASSFQKQELPQNAPVSGCWTALSGDTALGHVVTVTVNGYKGEIEVTMGLTQQGALTDIVVGGSNFSETAGLGARVKEPAFTEQFSQAIPPITLGETVDAVSGATISSAAVASGVNRGAKFLSDFLSGGSGQTPYEALLSRAAKGAPLPPRENVTNAWQLEDGYIVAVTEQGYHGAIHLAVALEETGIVTQVAIDEADFTETAGLGERVLESAFLDQFSGLMGIIGVTPGATAWTDSTSGATAQADWGEEADVGGGATVPVHESSGISGAEVFIDGVSGATISSTAVARGVNTAVSYVKGL